MSERSGSFGGVSRPRRIATAWWCGWALIAIGLLGCGSERPAAEAERRSDNDTVALSGHLSSDTAAEDESLRFWITVENRTATPIENLRIAHLDTPGFKKLRWCWEQGADAGRCGILVDKAETEPVCKPPSAVAGTARDEFLLCQFLKPGESLSVWGDLRVYDPQLPAQRLYAVVTWKAPPAAGATGEAATITTSSRVVPLGTAEPVSSFHLLTWLAKPEVSIPGGLTVLGLLLAWWSGRREERSKVFTAMLKSVHDAVVHYHMPMTSMLAAATTYIREAADAKKGGTPNLESARRGFYYLTMFHWWQRRVFTKVGAYQLKSRTGESLVGWLAYKHRKLYPLETETEWRQLDAVLGALATDTTLDDFLQTLDNKDPDFTKAWNDFCSWLGTDNCYEDLIFLEAFIQVMVYEANSLHDLWYGSRQPMKLSEETRKKILEVAGKGSFGFEVEAYLQKAEDNDTKLRLWN